jgi:hypothetical protein
MTIIAFLKRFTNEEACKRPFKAQGEKQGLFCKNLTVKRIICLNQRVNDYVQVVNSQL